MNSYTLKKVTGTPDWSKIPAVGMDVVYRAADVKAWAQLCWDEAGLLVHLSAKENNIRCKETDPMAEICLDSCLEFFFRPTESMLYFNFEFNPACGLYLGYGSSLPTLIRLKVPDEKAYFSPEAYRTNDGWGITYRVPFTFIQQFFPDFDAYEGRKFYGNFYKCGDNTDHPHHMSWNKIDLPRLNFHSPQFFGELIFGGAE
ncbi:MAG: hypothetical protein E7454_07805 [Ruminococcaceae bacterium]|nr:hypothetical protein [Oscillospiraceae bacterium]